MATRFGAGDGRATDAASTDRERGAPSDRARQASDFARYHNVLNRSRWSARAGGRLLLGLLIAAFVPSGPVVVGIDDTIERRWGARIKARGIYRDPVRSSRGHFVKARGLRWLSMMLLVPVPWARTVWALPFLTVLVPSERWARERGVRHKSLVDSARQILLQLARWVPHRELVVVSDSSFSAIDLLAAVRSRVSMITRLRLDAQLFGPVPIRTKTTMGRPCRTGPRLPTLAERLAVPETQWRALVIPDWYGSGDRIVEVVTGCGLWSHPGRPVVPLRWLLVRDPSGRFKSQSFLSTEQNHTPEQMLTWFIRRWTIEVMFGEVRRHLGVETQRQWSDMAIARTTPVLLGLYALVALWANDLQLSQAITVRSCKWYWKDAVTFSDALAAVRRQLWVDETFAMSPTARDPPKVSANLLDRLTDLACYAA